MIQAIKQTREINSFVDVAIPSPRDLFRRYGKRLGSGGYADTLDDRSLPLSSGSTVISQIIHAEHMLKVECDKINTVNV